MKGFVMTPLLLAASLLVGPASAEPGQEMAWAETWTQAQRPGWTDDRGYDRRAGPRHDPDPPYIYRPGDPEPLPRYGPPSRQSGWDLGSGSEAYGGFGEGDARGANPAWHPSARQPGPADESGAVWSGGVGPYGDPLPPEVSAGGGSHWSGTPADRGGGASPQYRFRGDPEPGSAPSSPSWGDEVYRFRPLTEKELERRAQSRGWRPLDPADPAWGAAPGSRGLLDALTPPPRTYGFEPNPWLGH